MLFLCSPGNPTSKLLPLRDIRAILDDARSRNCIVVVDEAYVDFALSTISDDDGDDNTNNNNNKDNADDPPTAVGLVHEYDNVVVLQTMSKAFGLAAIRCGFCIGPPDVIQLMNNCKAPYNVNQLTSELALKTFANGLPQLETNIQTLIRERAKLRKRLASLPFVTKVYPSDANFILFRLEQHAEAVYTKMARDGGIVTRYRGHELHCTECLRVTVGTAQENDALLVELSATYAALISSVSK